MNQPSKQGRGHAFMAKHLVLRTGCASRCLLCNFPPWQTVFYHFRRFRLKGFWHLIGPSRFFLRWGLW